MARSRKADQQETRTVAERPLSTRARIAQEYDALLADFAVGDYGKVDLSADDQRLTVRSRLQAAARRRSMSLRFRPGPSTALIFHVHAADPALDALPAPAARPAAAPVPGPKPAVAAKPVAPRPAPRPAREARPQAPRGGAPRQQASQPERREPQPERREPQQQERRESTADRWGRMLPRWMREGGRANSGRPGNSGRRRPR